MYKRILVPLEHSEYDNAILDHIRKLLFETSYPQWMWNTLLISVVSTFASLAASVFAAYAIERLRFSGAKHTFHVHHRPQCPASPTGCDGDLLHGARRRGT